MSGCLRPSATSRRSSASSTARSLITRPSGEGALQSFFLLPLREKVPTIRVSWADEGFLSLEKNPSPGSISLRSISPPSPARGEGRTARLASVQSVRSSPPRRPQGARPLKCAERADTVDPHGSKKPTQLLRFRWHERQAGREDGAAKRSWRGREQDLQDLPGFGLARSGAARRLPRQ